MAHGIVEGSNGHRVFPGEAQFTIHWQYKVGITHCRLSIKGKHHLTQLDLVSPHDRRHFNLCHSEHRVEGYLILTVEEGGTFLGGRFSLGKSRYFKGIIASLSKPDPGYEPCEQPAHEYSKEPSRKQVEIPFKPPKPRSKEKNGEYLRFMWLAHPIRDNHDTKGFIVLANPESLALFRELVALRDEPDAADLMRASASAFLRTADAVLDLEELGQPESEFLEWNKVLSQLEGEVTHPQLLKWVAKFLGQPLDKYLESESFSTAFARVWMTLFAYALTPDQGNCVGNALIEVIRTFQFLNRLEDLDPCLTWEVGRQKALAAVPILPNGVVPPKPYNDEDGYVRALGIGELIIVKRDLLGYSRGEIAHTMNVLAGERIRLKDRHHQGTREEEQESEQIAEASEENNASAGQSSTASKSNELMGMESVAHDFSDLKVQSTGLCGIIDGTFSGETKLKQHRNLTSRAFAEQLTAQSANRIESQVRRSRRSFRYERHTRIAEQDIDRREQKDNQIGIYYWLKKHYRLCTETDKKSLVLEFLLPDPAEALWKKVVALTELEEKPPVALSEVGIEGPASIKVDNYLNLAQKYGVADLPTPPRKQVIISARFTNQPPNRAGRVQIPEGFQAEAARVTYLLSDSSASLVGFVGEATFERPLEQNLELITEASTTNKSDPGEGPASGKFELALGETSAGEIPMAFYSSTQEYSVSVQVQAELPESLFEDRFLAWQGIVFDALQTALASQCQIYRLARKKVLLRLISSRENQTVREALAAGILRLLGSRCVPGVRIPPSHRLAAPAGTHLAQPAQQACKNAAVPSCPPQTLRFLESALELDELTYTFFPWPPGKLPSCPSKRWHDIHITNKCFSQFLTARSARVLLAVRAGFERAVLFFLGYNQLWNPPESTTPAIEADVAVLGELVQPTAYGGQDDWEVTIPTTHLVLGTDYPCYANSPKPVIYEPTNDEIGYKQHEATHPELEHWPKTSH